MPEWAWLVAVLAVAVAFRLAWSFLQAIPLDCDICGGAGAREMPNGVRKCGVCERDMPSPFDEDVRRDA